MNRADNATVVLTPAAAPKDLVAIARLERFENAATTVARWMNLPFDVRMADAFGPGLSRTIDLAAPIEGAVALADGASAEVAQPYAVFSAGVTSLEAARSMFEQFGRKMEPANNGAWITSDETPMTCAIAPALGRAKVRLVCGDRRIDVETLLPYATRGLPLLSMGPAEAHFELKMNPIRERYGQRLRQGKALVVPMALAYLGIKDTRISRPLTDIMYGLGDEVVDVMDDLERVSFDISLSNAPEALDLTTSLAFGHAHSWTAQTLADSAKRAALAPKAFFDLPNDAGAASFVTTINPKNFETALHRLEALIDGALAHVEVNQKLRDGFSRSLDNYVSQPWSGACAMGVPSSTSAAKTKPSLGNVAPWQVCAYESLPPASITDLLDALARLSVDKQVQKVIGRGNLTVRKVAAAKGLPSGTLTYDIKIDYNGLATALVAFGEHENAGASDKKAGKATDTKKSGEGKDLFEVTNMRVHIYADGPRTWILSGTDPKQLEAHWALARKGEPSERLASLSELAWLGQRPSMAGGFMSLAYVGSSIARSELAAKKRQLADTDVMLSTAPHHGQTPLPFLVEPGGTSGSPELKVISRLPRPFFEDLVAFAGSQLLKM